ncbi:hypothetical protein DFJ58DRAFT_843900 [Suillus subalutaceus]|uniref:uncharacterized protein n=1 Tax=Suillus subalutaceus TaxID=48586 RepID=UPI001B873CAA|nr:uncharacterized protein DFJ58DRAFT_843900 [Suillus subalutaceus]KAG1844795.1 hypothetical protein DFJ58DRAFT_843900 [Suillus subalutaceus]
MTNEITHFATIFTPEGHFDNSDGAPWQRVLLTMCFLGRLPRQTIQRTKIPVHISVAIAEEYGPFTSLVMEAISVDLCSTHLNSPLMDDILLCAVNSQSSQRQYFPQEDVSIPFLPLRGTFDYANPMELARAIEGYQRMVGDRSKWPMWDPRVPLEGTFIQEWLGQSSDIDAMQLWGNHSLLTLLSDLSLLFLLVCIHCFMLPSQRDSAAETLFIAQDCDLDSPSVGAVLDAAQYVLIDVGSAIQAA